MKNLPNFDEITHLLIWSEENLKAIPALATLASQLCDGQANEHLVNHQNPFIKMAIRDGILVEVNNTAISFKDDLTYEFFYAVHDATSILSGQQKSWEEIDELLWAKVYRQKSGTEIRLSVEYSSLFYIVVNNIVGINLLQLWTNNFDNLYLNKRRPIDKILHHFRLDVKDLMAFLNEILAKNPTYLRVMAVALARLSEYQPALGEQLLMELESSAQADLTNCKPGVFNGLAKAKGLNAVLPILLERLQSINEQNILHTLHTISILPWQLEDWDAYKQPLSAEIEQKRVHPNHLVRLKLLDLLVTLYPFTNLLEEYIITLSEEQKTENYQKVSEVLWLHEAEYRHQPWYRSALTNLSNWNLYNEAAKQHISFLLHGIIEQEPELFADYMNQWISNSNNPIKQIFVFQDHLLEFFVKHPKQAATWLTLALLSPDSRFHLAIHHTVSNFGSGKLKGLDFDKKILDSCSVAEIRYILFKILGYVYSKEILETLCIAILMRQPEDQMVNRLVINAFKEHILLNYGGTLSFLNVQKDALSITQQALIEELIAETIKNNESIRSIRSIPELRYRKKGGINLLQVKMKKLSQEVSQSVEDHRKNSFLSMLNRVNIKGGKGFFGKHDGKYSIPAQMSHFSSSFEMPVGEAIDPVNQKLNLLNWREFKYPL